MKIGIIGPAPEEINPFKSKINSIKKDVKFGLDIVIGTYHGIDLVVTECGIGKVNAALMTQYLIDTYKITHFIVIGAAGAIDSNLAISDIVIANKIIHHDVDAGLLMRNHPYLEAGYFTPDSKMLDLSKKVPTKVFYGTLVTGEAFIDDTGREEIIHKFNPLAVDMETASMAQVCYINHIPMLAIRGITDTPNESGLEAFEKNLEKAVNSTTDYILKYLDVFS